MRTIAPTGFLYTFEFNEIRAKTAQEEFKENELGGRFACQSSIFSVKAASISCHVVSWNLAHGSST